MNCDNYHHHKHCADRMKRTRMCPQTPPSIDVVYCVVLPGFSCRMKRERIITTTKLVIMPERLPRKPQRRRTLGKSKTLLHYCSTSVDNAKTSQEPTLAPCFFRGRGENGSYLSASGARSKCCKIKNAVVASPWVLNTRLVGLGPNK